MSQPDNPLHGITFAQIVTRVQVYCDWQRLARMININCFKTDSSITSPLTFLRRTPWARTEGEDLCVITFQEAP